MLVRRFTGSARFMMSRLASRVAVTHVWADGIGFVGAIDANAFFVQPDPIDTRRIVWTRWQHVKVRAAPSIFRAYARRGGNLAFSRWSRHSVFRWLQRYLRHGAPAFRISHSPCWKWIARARHEKQIRGRPDCPQRKCLRPLGDQNNQDEWNPGKKTYVKTKQSRPKPPKDVGTHFRSNARGESELLAKITPRNSDASLCRIVARAH